MGTGRGRGKKKNERQTITGKRGRSTTVYRVSPYGYGLVLITGWCSIVYIHSDVVMREPFDVYTQQYYNGKTTLFVAPSHTTRPRVYWNVPKFSVFSPLAGRDCRRGTFRTVVPGKIPSAFGTTGVLRGAAKWRALDFRSVNTFRKSFSFGQTKMGNIARANKTPAAHPKINDGRYNKNRRGNYGARIYDGGHIIRKKNKRFRFMRAQYLLCIIVFNNRLKLNRISI